MFWVISRGVVNPENTSLYLGSVNLDMATKMINRAKYTALVLDIVVGLALLAIGAFALVGYSKVAGIAMVAGGGANLVGTLVFNLYSPSKADPVRWLVIARQQVSQCSPEGEPTS